MKLAAVPISFLALLSLTGCIVLPNVSIGPKVDRSYGFQDIDFYPNGDLLVVFGGSHTQGLHRYHLNSEEWEALTFDKRKYFDADVAPNGMRVSVCRFDSRNTSHVYLLDHAKESLVKIGTTSRSASRPTISLDGSAVVYETRKSKKSSSIVLLNLDDGAEISVSNPDTFAFMPTFSTLNGRRGITYIRNLSEPWRNEVIFYDVLSKEKAIMFSSAGGASISRRPVMFVDDRHIVIARTKKPSVLTFDQEKNLFRYEPGFYFESLTASAFDPMRSRVYYSRMPIAQRDDPPGEIRYRDLSGNTYGRVLDLSGIYPERSVTNILLVVSPVGDKLAILSYITDEANKRQLPHLFVADVESLEIKEIPLPAI